MIAPRLLHCGTLFSVSVNPIKTVLPWSTRA